MNKSNRQYSALIERLDQFIRKYYLNQVIKGLLYVVGFATAYFLIIALLENYFYFGTAGRKVLFYSFLGLSIFTLIQWIILPAMKFFNLGSVISNAMAAQIIGDHFPTVKDKLLNILQLREQADSVSDSSLILAGIEQKTAELKPIQFKAAIDLSKNRKYLRYALPPVLLLLVLLLAAPSLIKNPTNRLIQNNKEFERLAPFQYTIKNKVLNVAEYENFPLQVQLSGESLPQEVTIVVNQVKTNLIPDKEGKFSYEFNNVQDNQVFQFEAAGFTSKPYSLKVLKKAAVEQVTVRLDYPSYTGREDETLQSIGDLMVPFGTKITWQFKTRNADRLNMWFEGFAPTRASQVSEQAYSFYKTAARDQRYSVIAGNAALPASDSISYDLRVISDQPPVISLDDYIDSTNNKLVYLNGNVGDDYGISRLIMVQQIKKQNGKLVTRTLPIQKPKGKQGFYSYLFDINSLNLEAGDDLKYYFEVFDNDAVRGPKSARTPVMSYSKPTVKEVTKEIEKATKDVQQELQQTLKESKKVQDQINKLKEKLLQQKSLSWEDKAEMERLLEKQLALQEKLAKTQEKLQKKQEQQEEVKPVAPEQKEKQEKIDKMMDELKNPEQDKMMDRIKELMQKLDKPESLKQLDQMKQQNKEFNQSMERMMELLKTLELENKVQEQVDKLNEMAEKQEKLSNETEKESKSQDQLEKEQKDLKKDFEDVKKKMDEIKKENKDLKAPKKLEDQEEQKKDLDQDMQDSQDKLEQKQNQKASKSQKSASKKMKQMAKQMSNDMAASQQEQIELDMAAVRQLLENILGLSFTQENLINVTNQTYENTPKYKDIMRDQMKIKTDFKMVDDSLQALSKRVIQIESFVMKKVTEVNGSLTTSSESLEDRDKSTSARAQQTAMKNLNDLALMLSDVMNQMQMQAAQAMPGNQMCKKPGGSNPTPGQGSAPMDKITEGQQKLSDKMKDQLGKMQNGQKPGSADYGQMASEQAKLRKMLQDLDNATRQGGKGKSQLREDIMNAMDQIEKDLVNRRLTNEMILRQQQIMTRLLEDQRAQRNQDQEEQRQANTAKQQISKVPPSMEEYIKKREAGLDEYRPVNPALTPYYKRLVEQYYNQIRPK